MYVYFVRHGLSTLGEENRYQFPNSPLSEQGRKQSHLIANRLSNLDFDILISSPFKRALETADIINLHHNKLITVSDLFQETNRQSEIEGKSKDDPEVRNVLEQVSANWHKDGWRHSDEESFIELRDRGRRALDYLTKMSKEKILIITHGDILKMLISIMQHGKEVDSLLFNAFRVFAPAKNAGFTVCYYGLLKQGERDTRRWYLISWNDDAHLM